ncbi:MAG: hypothetical protein ABI772_02210 [Bacteroidota bacterium]
MFLLPFHSMTSASLYITPAIVSEEADLTPFENISSELTSIEKLFLPHQQNNKHKTHHPLTVSRQICYPCCFVLVRKNKLNIDSPFIHSGSCFLNIFYKSDYIKTIFHPPDPILSLATIA